ncbi:MAG TPA: class II fumarate hydratase [Bryobacteraceae bacterium]|nr:class II fumarate hydratase [Bryobacteraceae bacterium]
MQGVHHAKKTYTEGMSETFRTEHDTMGAVQVPASALYGAQTQRAAQNFPISGLRMPREFLRALAIVKSAAARANAQLGLLPEALASALQQASEEVLEGRHDAEFIVDIFQTGSGTSTNMNINEVIATLAGRIANTRIHPNDHVNLSQSSNDVFPTALHVAAAESVHQRLIPAMDALHSALDSKARQFWNILKIGRTHLQDAVPIRLGQEFGGYAHQVALSRERLFAALEGIYELPLGGTATGSGLNAPAGFAKIAIDHISERVRLPFCEAKDHFEAQASRDAAAFLSAALKTYALALTKIANDLRWLSSGPRCGLGELRLPETQPGSSIMPGKVNPVIAESVLMVCAQVIGYDAAISWCCASGNLELNTMMPVMAYDLLHSIELLANASQNFADKCISGIDANEGRLSELVERSLALCTALTPEIGYERAAALAKKASVTGKTIREVAQEESGIAPDRLAHLLDPWSMAGDNA